jgi:hypothetical protein
MLEMIINFFKGIGKVIKNFWENYQEEILEALQFAIVIGMCVGLFYIAGPLLFPMMTASLGMILGSSTLGTLAAVSLSAIMMLVSIGFAGYMLKKDVVSKGFDWLGDKWSNWNVVHPPKQADEETEEETLLNTNRSKVKIEEDEAASDFESDDADEEPLRDNRRASSSPKWQSQPAPHQAKSNTTSSSFTPYTVQEPDEEPYTVTSPPNNNPKTN